MQFEYLTVLFSEKPKQLDFVFADGSKAIITKFQDFLNHLGAKGWELAAIMPLDSQTLNQGGRETVSRLIFKRRKE